MLTTSLIHPQKHQGTSVDLVPDTESYSSFDNYTCSQKNAIKTMDSVNNIIHIQNHTSSDLVNT